MYLILTQNERNAISVLDLNMRTTSSIEAINSVIQGSFPEKTNIFKFTDSLKLYESIKASDLYQLILGNISNTQLERKREKDKLRDKKIRRLTRKLKKQTISVEQFLQSMSQEKVLPEIGT